MQQVLYPNDDELDGLVYVGWRGPSGTTNLYVFFATIMMMEYLTDSPISPFQAAFVEADQPLASDVSYSIIENLDCSVYLSFENVPIDNLEHIKPKTSTILDQVLDDGIDLHRMKTLIEKRVLQYLGQREHSPHDVIAQLAISQFLYGTSEQDVSWTGRQFFDISKILVLDHLLCFGLSFVSSRKEPMLYKLIENSQGRLRNSGWSFWAKFSANPKQ